jgi:GT2 family glycosyltransferase
LSAELSLVLVAHRSSAVAPAAVASFRREAGRLGVSAEVVIVDHSEDPGEALRLRSLEAEKLLVLPNRGYAAGVNAGGAASTGAILLVGNPDVALQEDALAPLLGGIRAGWDIVGPQFVLAGFLFPPADLQTPHEELLRWLASRSRSFWDRYFSGEVRRWRRVWEARGPVAVPNLSGALLAFRRETFDRVGPWDEGFFLYFEETDWLRRAAAAGLRIAVAPEARVVHRWGHAADPAAMSLHFLRSRRRFLLTRFGLPGRLAASLNVAGTPLRPRPLVEGGANLRPGELLWLLSPTSTGFPAAGYYGTATAFMRVAEEFYDALARPGHYLVFAVEPASGELLGPWSWERADG